MKRLATALALVMALASGVQAARAETLASIKERGELICGGNGTLAGFGLPDPQGNWTGFDVDFCRAMAAAIFNDPKKVKFVPLTAKDRFTALQSGEIDVLVRNTTWTLSRDTSLGLDFPAITYYDGQGFMVRKDSGIKSASQLDGASICIIEGSTTELNIADYFRAHKMRYQVVTFADVLESRRAYDAGRCDVWSSDKGNLAARGLALKNRADHIILPETIMRDPLGPLVRKDDPQWFDIVRWTLYALIEAEDLGVTQANVEEMRRSSDNPEVKRLLGANDEFGSKNDLSNDWAYAAIKAVGNYGEIFDRYLGPKTPLSLDRDLNRLWKDGGLLYAPPFR